MSRLLHQLYAFNARWFRGKRFEAFTRLCQLGPGERCRQSDENLWSKIS
jgi:hypothetical protein